MLTPQDLIKLAQELEPTPEPQHSPIRKAVDTVAAGGLAVGGAVASGVQAINSFERPAPIKHIA